MRNSSMIRRGLTAFAVVALAAASMTGTASAHGRDPGHGHGGRPHHHPAPPHYYVSLGDSLAAGYQPDSNTNTSKAYTDQLYAKLKKQDPRLVHIKLGCSGETTGTLINGGICSYPGATSQLDAAVKFLRAHRGEVRYVTLDIGANNVDGCLTGGTIDQACTTAGVATVATQLPQIARALHRAGGDAPRYVGMNYYDPFLAVWLTGAPGQALARQSVQLSTVLNGVIDQGLRHDGFAVADVSKAFSTDDFTDQVTLPGLGAVPLNVARICAWTWECTPYQNIHANTAGYGEIATVFAQTLAHRR
ncbi:SGNH/GDSL hydrolase family protein [Streptacidiphilus cavernicola]|uniref:SGNH/GDSL hydrolase family protein n=1 Tax=Streptacidiphilus cavernicola TaxID=3342716 RepID=A0ABV6VN50_9ACTN